MLAPSSSPEGGKRLRAERERLRLSTRAVERISQRIAQEKKNQALYVSHNWVTDVENGKFTPSFPKLYSLSLIYECDITELFSLFGLNVRDLGKERGLISLPYTHLIRPGMEQTETVTAMPPDLREKVSLEHTNLVHRMFQGVGEIPLFMLQQADPRHSLYGYIGSEDYTLEPLIRPGSLVQIDARQTKITKGVWLSEHDRPVYFTELRDNCYACSWCELDGGQLLLIPSPQSQMPIRHVRYPQDAEIVGRVTVVTMRIADSQQDPSGQFPQRHARP
jgi:transcriptional regulator with XRE-family HTH domain